MLTGGPLGDQIENESMEKYKDYDLKELNQALTNLRRLGTEFLVSLSLYHEAMAIKRLIREWSPNDTR